MYFSNLVLFLVLGFFLGFLLFFGVFFKLPSKLLYITNTAQIYLTELILGRKSIPCEIVLYMNARKAITLETWIYIHI